MSSEKISIVIFDLDGTLLDTIQDLADATNYALQQEGLPIHPTADYKQFVGHGIHNLFVRAAAPADPQEDLIGRIKQHFKTYYAQNGQKSTKPYDQIMQLLKSLQERGVKLAVASNKYQEGVSRLVEHYFSEICFAQALGQREGIPTKPDPYILEEILKLEGISKEECLYVGDMEVDLVTAQGAQVKGVGVTWGFRSKEELQPLAPYAIIDNPLEILELLKK